MQTLDSVGCSDNSFTLHAVHNFGVYWCYPPTVGQVFHCVSGNQVPKHCTSIMYFRGDQEWAGEGS